MASPDDPIQVDEGPATGPAGSPLGRVPVTAPVRGFLAGGLAVAAIVVLLAVKPWALAPRPAPLRGAVLTLAPAPAPSPTFDRSPEALAASICLGTDAWRVASLETWQITYHAATRSQSVRVWRAITPVTGPTTPDDPTIPIIGVAATQVDALGWCAPYTGPDRPGGPIDVTIWRLDPGGAAAVPVRRVAPVGGDTPLAALYREVSDCVAGFGCSGAGVPLLAPSWATARYVFQYVDHGSGRTRWFGADVVVLPVPPDASTP